MNPKIIGFIDNGTGVHQSNQIYSILKCCPSITTIHGGTQQIKILIYSSEIKHERNNNNRFLESAERISRPSKSILGGV